MTPLLERLARLDGQFVLVGGQALNYWAGVYANRVPELQAHGPYVSDDLDFVGTREEVVAVARVVDGEVRMATLDDATPNLAVVRYVDEVGEPRIIDFLATPLGPSVEEIHRTALSVRPESSPTEGAAQLKVMHPVLCMESRVTNVLRLPKYQGARGVRQARAAVLCAREFLRDLLAAGEVRAVLNLNERIFRFATTRDRRTTEARFGVRPFDAVLSDLRLPAAFLARRYPQMASLAAGRNGPTR